jgi:RNA polymerase sigma-70 factor (ECF subfamily)
VEVLQGTLGAVLYATPKAVAPESEWVALVRAVAAGDQGALHGLYERAHRPVYTLIVRITSNRETAEELTLDVFLDVWRRAAGYDPANGTVLGWIMNQARSRALDRLRHDGRRKRVAPSEEDPMERAVAQNSYEAIELKQQGEALRGALTLLRPEEREAIEAAFFSELSYAEVAARLDVPLGTVKTRIRAGLHKLRQAMAAGVREA